MDKRKIRAEITALKKMLPVEDIYMLSKHLTKQFCELEEYKKADVIYAYMSANEEVRTEDIIRQAWADGKRVAIPKTYNNEYMEFVYITSLDEGLTPGFAGILEPDDGEIATPDDVLMLMPGLAFDLDLNRVGYGGGFYDKYLAKYSTSHFRKVALCYDFQIYKHFDSVDVFDEKVDLVVSPTMKLPK